MKRRDFLMKSLPAAAGTALAADKLVLGAEPPEKADFAAIAKQRASHPLYFDGMTFWGGTKNWVAESGLTGLIWDVSTAEAVPGQPGRFKRNMIPCLKSLARANAFLRANKDGVFLATRGSQIPEAHRAGRTAVFLQFQSANPVTEDLGIMDVYYEMGLRVMQFNHHANNIFAGGGLEMPWTGLTWLGTAAVERMNEIGMIPDISHANELVGKDVLEASRKPVILTHTGCRALCRNARCAPDSLIKGVADSGGVVGIFSMSFWLTEEPTATLETYIRQLEHVIKVGGIDAVGIANDYDTAGIPLKDKQAEARSLEGYRRWFANYKGVLGFDRPPQHFLIPEINNIRRFFTIQEALEKRGYDSARIEKIMGGNWVRMLTENLG
jgi:membrane dipeptidase